MKADIIDGFKYIRHHDLVFLGDAQNFGKVDAAVRKLTTDVIYILSKKDVYGKKHRFSRKKTLLRTEWEFIWVKHQQAENAASLGEMGIEVREKNARKCKLIYEGNIYSQYNSQSGKPYWYRGIKQFSVEKHPENVRKALKRTAVRTHSTTTAAHKKSNETTFCRCEGRIPRQRAIAVPFCCKRTESNQAEMNCLQSFGLLIGRI